MGLLLGIGKRWLADPVTVAIVWVGVAARVSTPRVCTPVIELVAVANPLVRLFSMWDVEWEFQLARDFWGGLVSPLPRGVAFQSPAPAFASYVPPRPD